MRPASPRAIPKFSGRRDCSATSWLWRLARVAGLALCCVALPLLGWAQGPLPSPGEVSDAASVKLGDTEVFVLHAPRPGESVEARAQRVSNALSQAAHEGLADSVRVQWRSSRAHIYAGSIPIVALDAEDARRAGDPSLELYADEVAQAVKSALRIEASRSYTANLVLMISLCVVALLVAWYAARRVRELADRAVAGLTSDAELPWPALVRRHELIKPATLRAGLVVGVSVGRVIAQIGIAYGWLLFSLGLFPGTRNYVFALTSASVAPLTRLLTSVSVAVPGILVLAGLCVAAAVAMRFVALYFRSVERGETALSWLSPELASPAGTLAQGGIVVFTVVLASPVLAAAVSPPLGVVSTLFVAAGLLAAVPILAGVVAGLPAVFGRRLRVGDFIQVGTHEGAVESIGLAHFTVMDPRRGRHWVPHLATLVTPVTIQVSSRRYLRVEVRWATSQTIEVVDLLPRLQAWLDAVSGDGAPGPNAPAVIERVDPSGARVRIACSGQPADGVDLSHAERLQSAAAVLGLTIASLEVVSP